MYPNLLDCSTIYNIKSASHTILNAVLGCINLDVEIKTTDGDDLMITQRCLILQPELDISIVLLGTDFMLSNNDGTIIVHVQG